MLEFQGQLLAVPVLPVYMIWASVARLELPELPQNGTYAVASLDAWAEVAAGAGAALVVVGFGAWEEVVGMGNLWTFLT
jgi:hypothetical protein